jgi:hypothetical protein
VGDRRLIGIFWLSVELQRSLINATIADVPNDHSDLAFTLLAVPLWRPAPTTIQQRGGSGHARRFVLAVLRNAGENLDA